MIQKQAKQFAKKLIGSTCSGWKIDSYINCGKSAIVLKATNKTKMGALKIFFPELIEKYGAEIQMARIRREKTLVGKSHPNLVQIFDGGFWKERNLFFVVMEYLPWRNLADALVDIPKGEERNIISQIASAAQFLEELNICHRDIKPENIGISNDFKEAKLLDLGVIRLHDTPPLTDGTSGKVFIGTLKYSPPEFLLREENDSKEGWRALTFYQLGGVLHDLIMRRSLFSEYVNPFAVLVNAVQHKTPEIVNNSVSPFLVDLATHCLLKKPESRLKLVSWPDFEKEPDWEDPLAATKTRISRRMLAKRDSSDAQTAPKNPVERLNEYAQGIKSSCQSECIGTREYWPPIEIHIFSESDDRRIVAAQFDPSTSYLLQNHLRIELTVEWIDQEQDVIEIHISAFISFSPFAQQANVAAGGGIVVFKGVYAVQSVRHSFLPTIYRALELAQQAKKLSKNSIDELNLAEIPK